MLFNLYIRRFSTFNLLLYFHNCLILKNQIRSFDTFKWDSSYDVLALSAHQNIILSGKRSFQ